MQRVKKKIVNAAVIVEKTKERVYCYINPKRIPADSFERLDKGRWIHKLGVDLNGQLWAIEPPPAVKNKMPSDLFVSKRLTALLVRNCYATDSGTMEKIKFGIFVGLIIAILVTIFLITASAGG